MSDLRLFYFQPDGHGPASLFVLAGSAEAAAADANRYRQVKFAGERYPDIYRYGVDPYTAADFKAADIGEVIENDND